MPCDQTIDKTALLPEGLLPCPFCGSAARMTTDTFEHWVECTKLGVCIANRALRHGGCHVRDDAIRLWNARPAAGEPVAVTDKMIDDSCPCVGGRLHDWKKLDSGNTVCMFCGNHRPWLVDRLSPAPSLAVSDEMEALRAFANSFHITVIEDSVYKDVTLHMDAPHSLSIRIRNDSSKSWIFKDLEDRRRAALTAAIGAHHE